MNKFLLQVRVVNTFRFDTLAPLYECYCMFFLSQTDHEGNVFVIPMTSWIGLLFQWNTLDFFSWMNWRVFFVAIPVSFVFHWQVCVWFARYKLPNICFKSILEEDWGSSRYFWRLLFKTNSCVNINTDKLYSLRMLSNLTYINLLNLCVKWIEFFCIW